MNVAAISMLPLQGAADAGALAGDPARLAKEFDAILLRLLLADFGASPLSKDDGAGDAGTQAVLGQMLAHELAARLDLGLGAALLREASAGTGGAR